MQRVLIIDDDQIFAETAQRAFEREGFEAAFECSADSALTKALTWRPEFVLLAFQNSSKLWGPPPKS